MISLDLVCRQSDQIVIIEGNKNDGNRSEFGVARVLTISPSDELSFIPS